jgi:heterodisulfide reductase subunit A
VFDVVAKVELQLDADRVILGTPIVPHRENHDLASILKVPLNHHGFFLEAHPKLRPVEFETGGIYLCGPAHSPQWVSESYSQALAAASKALIPLMQGKIYSEAVIAEADADKCIACANCVAACPYDAINIERLAAKVDVAMCRGCGVCVVECPANAITLHHFTDDQISSMVKAALEETVPPEELRILAFFCNWCSYAGADMAGVSRFKYPPNVRIIRVMCSGRVETRHILESFILGADGVLVGGCHPGDCHYISGNLKAERRVKEAKGLLEETGIGGERLRLRWFSAGEGKKLAEELTEFTDVTRKLGPNPLRRVTQEDA